MRRLIAGMALILAIAPVMTAGENDDPSKWTPIQIHGQQQAPEFADVTEWLNGPALKMSKLKGKVVVVHFLAFG